MRPSGSVPGSSLPCCSPGRHDTHALTSRHASSPYCCFTLYHIIKDILYHTDTVYPCLREALFLSLTAPVIEHPGSILDQHDLSAVCVDA